VELDNGDNGSEDDAVVLNGGMRLFDDFTNGARTGFDVDDHGTNDGEGYFVNDGGGFDVYELSHPLDSGDKGHDVALSLGSHFGLRISVRMIAAAAQFPQGFGDTDFPARPSCLHFVIAA
jgi:hypothetical protein